jgi:hypothetical protein
MTDAGPDANGGAKTGQLAFWRDDHYRQNPARDN